MKIALSEGLNESLSSSTTEDFKESLELKFNEETQSSTTETVDDSNKQTTPFTNTSSQDLFVQLYSDQSTYNAPYSLEGVLTYDINLPASYDTVVGYYEDTYTGFADQALTHDLSDVLKATYESNISDTYPDLTIDAASQSVSTVGTYKARNQNSSFFWFYFNDDEDCGNDSITDLLNGQCEGLDDVSSARSKEPESFSWKGLKKAHKSDVTDTQTHQVNIDGTLTDVEVGMHKPTVAGTYSLGTNHHDYHHNQSSKSEGGAILHEGADQYIGNKKSDFVSSKTLGGVTVIKTGKGDDRVFIDSSDDFDEITRGHTSLGQGKDMYQIKGSADSIPATHFHYESLETGKGKDRIKVKGNTKLSVQDFNPFLDKLIIDFEDYEFGSNRSCVFLRNEEGSAIHLKGVIDLLRDHNKFNHDKLAKKNPSLVSPEDAGINPSHSAVHEFASLLITGDIVF